MGSSKINSDMAFEILSRTDIKDLDLCKTACNEWNDISFESTFTPTHCERTGTISGYFVQNPKERAIEFVAVNVSNKHISLGFLPIALRAYSKIVASTKQGILCCESSERKREGFFICKPSTREWVKLPSPKMRYHTEKVGITVVGSHPLRYKIIRVSKPNNREFIGDFKNYFCEIFDSKTRRWTKLNDVWLPYDVSISNRPSVVVGGSIYWLLSNDCVLEFNTYTKNHTTLPLPQPLLLENPQYAVKQLVEYKSKLGFICSEGDCYLLRWILDDRRNHIWQEIEALSLEDVRGKDLGSCIGFWNADIAVMTKGSNISFYNSRNGNFEKVELRGDNNIVFHDNIFAFRSDLEPTQLFCRD